jgi:hypothetical protein
MTNGGFAFGGLSLSPCYHPTVGDVRRHPGRGAIFSMQSLLLTRLALRHSTVDKVLHDLLDQNICRTPSTLSATGMPLAWWGRVAQLVGPASR